MEVSLQRLSPFLESRAVQSCSQLRSSFNCETNSTRGLSWNPERASSRCTQTYRSNDFTRASLASEAAAASTTAPRATVRQIPEPPTESADSAEDRPRGRFLRDDVGPNAVVLEAQARVCTGPTMTRPMEEEKMREVLELILLSAKGELPIATRVSQAQMGAFFGAMALRATTFPPSTQWSPGEHRAMADYWPELRRHLSHDVLFVADPEGSIMGGLSPVGPTFVGMGGRAETRLVGALREVIEGGHLGFEETMAVLKDVLPMRGDGEGEGVGEGDGEDGGGVVSDALVAAFLIGQRMNRETDRELKAYCMALDDELDPLPLARVRSLTHYGEPYDGNTRFFRPSLFTAAVRASYGEACLLHGTDWMPPKCGVTEEQMLRLLGAATTLSPAGAAQLLEDPEVGMAYISLREGHPSWYSLVDLRLHMKKRPPLATTEKVQRFVKASGREAMVSGFYHEGYEEPLLMLIRRQAVAAGLVIKGEEGALSFMTRPRGAATSVKGRAVNYCAGFRPMQVEGGKGGDGDGEEGFHRETFSMEVDATTMGFEPSMTPRIDRSAARNLELGMEALRDKKGAAYDRIVFNAAMTDHLLGCQGAENVQVAIQRAKDAISSGRALAVLETYVRKSRELGSE